MNRNDLNNEIVLCRSAVRRAKVIIVRKICKKMKILKTCKIEDVKEKKMKKAMKLYTRLQIMKKLKDDDVTKFALLNENYDTFLKQSKNMRKAALATLARHNTIQSKVLQIREKIPDWKTTLPNVLNSSRRKTLSEKKPVKKETRDKNSQPTSAKKNDQNKEKPTKNSKSVNKNSKCNAEKKISKHSEECKQQDKIDDPFFIEKKVIPPKLIQEDHLEEVRKTGKGRETSTKMFRTGADERSNFHNLSFKEHPIKNEKNKVSENLHPSWAAKKVKLIKPFEGKKIKFTDIN